MEEEFDEEAKKVLDVLQLLQKDSAFFINDKKSNNAKFSLEKNENEISPDEREIRWHSNVNEVLSKLVAWQLKNQRRNSEILQLKEDLKQKDIELKNAQADFINQKSIMVDQIKTLTEITEKNQDAFVKFRNKVRDEIVKLQSETNYGEQFHSTPQHQFPQVKLKPPTFSGNKTDRPKQFLTELKKYVEVMHITDDALLPVLQQSLTKNAASWFYTIEHNIDEFIDFEIAFLERKWNDPIKSALRTKLKVGEWDPAKKATRVEYAQQLITIMKELDMDLNDYDKMTLISDHFDDNIARTIRLQGIRTTGHLYDLLQDHDRIDERNRSKKEKAQNSGAMPKYKGNYRNNFKLKDQTKEVETSPEQDTKKNADYKKSMEISTKKPDFQNNQAKLSYNKSYQGKTSKDAGNSRSF